MKENNRRESEGKWARMKELYRKYREVLLYLFFGGLTFLVSVLSFSYCNVSLGIDELVANVISWILAVSFAFFTNRTWVFQAPTEGAIAFIRQLLSFFGGRIATLLVEEAILFVFIKLLDLPGIPVKVAAQIVVIALNYVISKTVVFRRYKKDT